MVYSFPIPSLMVIFPFSTFIEKVIRLSTLTLTFENYRQKLIKVIDCFIKSLLEF